MTLSGANANIFVGAYVNGTGVAANTYVTAINGTSVTLNQNFTGSTGSQALTFGGSVEVFGTINTGAPGGYGGVVSFVNPSTGNNLNSFILRPGGTIRINDVAGQVLVAWGAGRTTPPAR